MGIKVSIQGSGQTFGRRSIKQRQTIETNKLNKLDISTTDVDIDILIHDKPMIDIMLETYKDGPELSVDYSGEVAEIVVKSPNTQKLFQVILSPCRLQITVPSHIADNWQMITDSGDIIAPHLIADSFHIQSGSGSLELIDNKAKNLFIKTTSGDISAREMVGNELQFETTSGEVELDTINCGIMGSTISGDVAVFNIQGENLRINTSSGEVDIKNTKVNKAVFNTASGDIKADNLHAEKILLKASSGDIKLADFSGDIKGYTSSGSIKLASINDSILDIGTGSGDVRIAFEKADMNAAVDIKIGSGDIMMNIPIEIHKQAKRELAGIIGDGKNSISIQTGSGDVVMYSQDTDTSAR